MSIVNLQVSFESLIEAVTSLSLEDKRKLADILEDAIFETEEDLENDPEVLAEVEEARKDYREGNYQTIQEYAAQRSERET
ncbi:hypothetical protein [Leptolyngbya sp. NIES-2104]|uniref:hypothetical protein n=1 Tax=Leptolyngbya sp. NIES-2104 TaxID=1552121 RepID=UPI0006EC45B8|nr:hypothetical protein [Leptolyngbya sp. NIES-2104]GAP98430.1 hypothetical protein NIES2104_49850 [Leptolyngbya sp. NIES-2104]